MLPPFKSAAAAETASVLRDSTLKPDLDIYSDQCFISAFNHFTLQLLLFDVVVYVVFSH